MLPPLWNEPWKAGVSMKSWPLKLSPPSIPKTCFLYHYPSALAALARLSQGAPGYAERFELYVAGVELANAFSELTDPVEQKARFEKELAKRDEQGKTSTLCLRSSSAHSFHAEVGGHRSRSGPVGHALEQSEEIDPVVSFTPEEL